MQRGLDHVVHLVRDLDAAGEVYDLLGFTVGPRNQHPWGTENRIVQTPGFYVELLQIAAPEKNQPAAGAAFSFGGYNATFLAAHGEGLSMLALEGKDPIREKAGFDEAGFGAFDILEFSRIGRRPDGHEMELGFSLAFARDPLSPGLSVFTSTQRRPDDFWTADLQRHANTVSGVAGVVMVAESPVDHQAFIDTVTGASLLRVSASWYTAKTPRGQIDVMTHAAFTERYGVPAPGGEGLRLAALRFVCPGALELRRALAARRMVEEAIAGVVVVPPRAALGATLVFEREE